MKQLRDHVLRQQKDDVDIKELSAFFVVKQHLEPQLRTLFKCASASQYMGYEGNTIYCRLHINLQLHPTLDLNSGHFSIQPWISSGKNSPNQHIFGISGAWNTANDHKNDVKSRVGNVSSSCLGWGGCKLLCKRQQRSTEPPRACRHHIASQQCY